MDWRDRSACLDEDPDLFFPIGRAGPALAQVEDAQAGVPTMRRQGSVPLLGARGGTGPRHPRRPDRGRTPTPSGELGLDELDGLLQADAQEPSR